MITMYRMAIAAARPAGWPISLRQSRQAQAVAAGRQGQDEHVLHGARQADAHDQPHQPREVPELDRQHGADQGTCPGDRREMVPEQDPPVRGVKVLAVIHAVSRRRPRVIERSHLGREKRAVVAISDRQDRQHQEHHRHGVNRHRPWSFMLGPGAEDYSVLSGSDCPAPLRQMASCG